MKKKNLTLSLLLGGTLLSLPLFHCGSLGDSAGQVQASPSLELIDPIEPIPATYQIQMEKVEQSRQKVEEITQNLSLYQNLAETSTPDLAPLPLTAVAEVAEEAEEAAAPIPHGLYPATATEEPVDLSYFADAAFIGDSRSQGLMAYSDIKAGGDLTGLALSVYNIWGKTYITSSSGTIGLKAALARTQYNKVYIALGINSVGYPSRETFYQKYTNLVEEVRALQPQAQIYIQNIIPVNEAIMKSRGTYSVFNNQVISEFNGIIHQVAQEHQLAYLDLYSYFLDNSGQLPSSASSDGIHLSVTYCKKWASYLQWHTAQPSPESQAVPESQAETENPALPEASPTSPEPEPVPEPEILITLPQDNSPLPVTIPGLLPAGDQTAGDQTAEDQTEGDPAIEEQAIEEQDAPLFSFPVPLPQVEGGIPGLLTDAL